MFKRRRIWILVLVVLLLAAGGGYYYYTTRLAKAETTTTESTLQTARVRRGDLVISATGSGTVVADTEVSLAFRINGTLTEVNARVGDKVEANDVLARVDDLDAREALATAQLQLIKAQVDLASQRTTYADFQAGATEAELLEARSAVKTAEDQLADLKAGPTQADVTSAQAAVASAKQAYQDLVNGPTAEELEQAQNAVSKAKNNLWSAQMSRDAKGDQRSKDSGAYDAAQVSVWNSEFSVRDAEIALADLQAEPTAAELAEAKAKISSSEQALADLVTEATAAEIEAAEATLAKAKEALADLEQGPTEEEVTVAEGQLKQAELTLAQAQLNVESVQADLDATSLLAPFAGTVMTVDAAVGERVVADTGIISVADLSAPLIEIYVDESDMAMLVLGYEVEVSFDAIPDQTFKGKVVQVDPQIAAVSNVNVLRGMIQLDAGSFAKPGLLLPGMSASVDVIGGRATNAVLVPLEALRDLGDDQYAVFVMENGEPRLQVVEVGLRDVTYAEVTSGLEGNETVTTGIVETR